MAAQVVRPVGQVDARAVELIRPNQRLPRITGGRLVPPLGRGQNAVVVANRAKSLLESFGEHTSFRTSEHHAELLVFLLEVVHHNLHVDGRRRSASRKDDGSCGGDEVFPFGGGQGPRFIVHGHVTRGGDVKHQGKAEDVVLFIFISSDVHRKSHLRHHHRSFVAAGGQTEQDEHPQKIGGVAHDREVFQGVQRYTRLRRALSA